MCLDVVIAAAILAKNLDKIIIIITATFGHLVTEVLDLTQQRNAALMTVHEGRNEVDELPGAAAKIKYETIIKKQTAKPNRVAESTVAVRRKSCDVVCWLLHLRLCNSGRFHIRGHFGRAQRWHSHEFLSYGAPSKCCLVYVWHFTDVTSVLLKLFPLKLNACSRTRAEGHCVHRDSASYFYEYICSRLPYVQPGLQ